MREGRKINFRFNNKLVKRCTHLSAHKYAWHNPCEGLRFDKCSAGVAKIGWE